MHQKHFHRPIKGVKFSTDKGKFISVGIWSNEILGFENRITGKPHLCTIKYFNDKILEGAIKIDSL